MSQDQQGQLLFNFENYENASKIFNDVHWKAFSAYGNEDYETAATFYSQFNDKENLLAQANALAHGRNYIKARDLYTDILNQYPNFKAAELNRSSLQAIIDEIIAANPEQAASVKEKPKAMGWFVGQVMKSTGGKANPQAVQQLVKAKLGVVE